MTTTSRIFNDLQFKFVERIEDKDTLIQLIQQHGGTIHDISNLDTEKELYYVISIFQGVLYTPKSF
jgi:hypothetical protein